MKLDNTLKRWRREIGREQPTEEHTWSSTQSFAPTHDEHSVVSVTNFPRNGSGCTIRCIDLSDALKTRWRLNQETLDRLVGDEVEYIEFAENLVRPCKMIPVYVYTRRGALDPELWSLDPEDGRLVKSYRTDLLTFYHLRPYASTDGAVVAQLGSVGYGPWKTIVVDMERHRLVRGFLLGEVPVEPFGIDRNGDLYFGSLEGIWKIAIRGGERLETVFLLDPKNNPASDLRFVK